MQNTRAHTPIDSDVTSELTVHRQAAMPFSLRRSAGAAPFNKPPT
jgi:hypothetical protein